MFVRFNQPVAPVVQERLPSLVVEPNVAGRTYFATPDLLVFEPARPLPLARRFSAQLRGRLDSYDGAAYTEPLTWTFETESPQVRFYLAPRRQNSDPQPRNEPVLLAVDQPVALEELGNHLVAHAVPILGQVKPSRSVAVQVNRASEADRRKFEIPEREVPADRLFALFPPQSSGWPSGSQISLTVGRGLRSFQGPLPTETPFSVRFTTPQVLSVEQVSCTAKAPCTIEPISFRFSAPIERKQTRHIRVTPQPAAYSADLLLPDGEGLSTQVVLNGHFRPDVVYRVDILGELADHHKQRLGKTVTVRPVFARAPMLRFAVPGGTLPPTGRLTVGVESRFVKAVSVRAVPLEAETLLSLLGQEGESVWQNQSRLARLNWPDLPSGQRVKQIIHKPQGPTAWASAEIDLREMLGEVRGAVLLEAKVTELVAQGGDKWPPPTRLLLRVTDLGPVLLSGANQSLLYVTRFSSGQPLAGAEVRQHVPGREPLLLGKTDAQGLLTLPGVFDWTERSSAALLSVWEASTADRAYLTFEERVADSPKILAPGLAPGEQVRSIVLSDRRTYGPDDNIRLFGVATADTPYVRSGTRYLAEGTPVQVDLLDEFRQVVTSAESKLSREGRFFAELKIPQGATIGSYTVAAQVLGESAQTPIYIEEARRLEFSVAAIPIPPDVVAGTRPTVRVTADYSYGGLVRIRKAAYQQRCHAIRFRPPNLPAAWDVGSEPPANGKDRGTTDFVEVLLASGDRPPPIGILEFAPAQHAIPEFASRCQVATAISDDAFQRSGVQTEYTVHPARYYLATAVPTKQARAGDVLRLPVRALYYDGSRLAAPGVKVQIDHRAVVPVYRSEQGVEVLARHEAKIEPVYTCTLDIPNKGGDPECVFTAHAVGEYVVTVRGAPKADTVAATTRTSFLVLPKENAVVAQQKLAVERLSIETAQQTVRHPGTLHVTLRGPKSLERGLLLTERNGIREVVVVAFHDGVAHHEFATDDSWVAGVKLRAVAVQHSPTQTVLEAQATVHGDETALRLRVQIELPKEAGPRSQVPVVVRVVNRLTGVPIQGARVSLWALDEAAMDFTQGLATPDRISRRLVEHFLPRPRIEIRRRDAFRSLIHPYSRQPKEPWLPPRGETGFAGPARSTAPPATTQETDEKPVSLDVRNDLVATPLFLADVATGPDGKVLAKLPLPDTLTTVRLFAVVSANLSDGKSPGVFGAADARVRVSAPVVLRAAIPRLLRPGDRAEITALVQNHTNLRGNLRLSAKLHQTGSAAPLSLASASVIEQTMDRNVPAKIPLEVLGHHAGTAEIELSATFSPTSRAAKKTVFTDTLRLPLVVEQERTQVERAVAHGVLQTNETVAMPIRLPPSTLPAPGGIAVSLSAAGFVQIEDAVRQLVGAQHRSLEHLASRLLPAVIAPELFKGTDVQLPEAKTFAQQTTQRLLALQLYHGGFGFWPDDQHVHPFGSAYATWVLHLALQAGHSVPADSLERAQQFLQKLLALPKARADGVLLTPVTERQAAELARLETLTPGSTVAPLSHDPFDSLSRALAVFVLAEMGQPQTVAQDALYTNRAPLPLFGKALLLMALHKASPEDLRVTTLTEELLAAIQVDDRTAECRETATYNLDALFQSPMRSQAAVIMALVRVLPRHPLIIKLLRGLLAARVVGGWKSTQENAWAILALRDFNRQNPYEGSDLTASVWLADQKLMLAKMPTPQTPPQRVDYKLERMLALVSQNAREQAAQPGGVFELPLLLRRTGQGTLHYRVRLEWTTPSTGQSATAHGIAFRRNLRHLGGSVAPNGSILTGEAVAMDLEFFCQQPVHHLALDIPLPAGLEAVQREGAVAAISQLSGVRSQQISFEEIRRDRVLLYFDALPAGEHKHTLQLRSTTPGRYLVPPAKATALYEPGLTGSTEPVRIWVH